MVKPQSIKYEWIKWGEISRVFYNNKKHLNLKTNIRLFVKSDIV